MSSTRLRLYHVDAFTRTRFGGNPAAVVPLQHWLDVPLMQAIASENNLSETAFFVPQGHDFAIRWFTPSVEVDLCGHATLASGWVVLNRLHPELQHVTFHSQSGPLTVAREGDALAMQLPSRPPKPEDVKGLTEALGRAPKEVYSARDVMAVYDSEEEVRALSPDMAKLDALHRFGFIVTARGRDVDFVSRYFAPSEGVPEDPVTGSAHSTLVPFWAKRLGKKTLTAKQLSRRGGEMLCTDEGATVRLVSHAVPYLEGEIDV